MWFAGKHECWMQKSDGSRQEKGGLVQFIQARRPTFCVWLSLLPASTWPHESVSQFAPYFSLGPLGMKARKVAPHITFQVLRCSLLSSQIILNMGIGLLRNPAEP